MADIQSNIQVNIDTTGALASIKNLQTQISAFHTSMARGGAAANAVTGQMQQNLINSINATGKFSAQMKTIRTTTESFTNSLEKNKFTLGEYFKYAGGASKTFGRLFKTEFDTINKVARENVKDLQTQYIKMGRDANGAMRAIAVRPLSLDMSNLATKTMIASEKQAILNQLLKQGSTNLLNFGKNTQWAGRQLMVGFTIPLIAVGSQAAKTFMTMETQAIRFKKVYGDIFTPVSESTAALESIKNLGKEFTKYGVAVSATVGLAADAAAAGFQGIDLQNQTTAATKLAILGQIDNQKALETTIALQNAFGTSSSELADTINFLNSVENQTVLSLDDITTAIPKAAPIVKQLGGDVKDLAFFLTAMKQGGINASEGANALKSGLASMINPTGKAAAMLESFGINVKKIVVDNRGDLKKTVIEFATALNQLDPLNRAQAIEQMFGKFQFARISTLMQNVTAQGTQASKVLDLAGASVQDLASLAEKELGITADSAMNKFKESVENLKLSLVPLGEEFLKAVTPIAKFVTNILDKFNNLGDGTKKIIVTLTAIFAGLGPVLLMTFGLLANGVANIIKGFVAVKTIFNKAGQSTATLGTEVKYMTLEQRNAAAVAASLDQVHRTLAQTFTAEASSVDALTRAYQRSIAAQRGFIPTAMPMGRGPVKPKGKFANGGMIVGPGGPTSDSVPIMASNGEAIISAKIVKKYPEMISNFISGNIPGFRVPGVVGRNIPGYDNGKPSAFSFGGQEFPVGKKSIISVRKLIAEIQQLGGVVSNIDDVIFKVLEDMTSELEKGKKITKAGLEKAMAASGVTELAKSTKTVQGSYSGNAGAVMAHGLPKVTLTPEQIGAFEGTTIGASVAGRKPGAPVTGLSNMVFPMPAAFNQGRMTGAEGAQWIGQNRARFTGDIAAQAGLDPNDPDLLRFGTEVGKALKSAAHRGVVVTQDDFEKIISGALKKEIFDVGKNTSTAVKAAFADAKKVSTIMFPSVSGSGRTGYSRVPVSEDMRGTTVDEIPLAQGSSYKNRGVTTLQHKDADKHTMRAIRARVRGFFGGMPKEVDAELKKVLDINSPSKVTKNIGTQTGAGYIAGVKESVDDAKKVGQEIGSSVVSGVSQSGRKRRIATKAQGAPSIGPDAPVGTGFLPIVSPLTSEESRKESKRQKTLNAKNKVAAAGRRMTGVGGGMGLLGVNMGLSMLPNFAGKGLAQGALAGANLGMMFGPQGMAVGAVIGGITSALNGLINKHKELQKVTEATFKSSASVAEFFGNKVVDTTLKMGAFKTTFTGLGDAANKTSQSFGFTNEELARFTALVQSLPEDNPLRTIVEGLTKENNPEKINELAKAFVNIQVAIGQLQPDQAQKTLDLILASSGNLAMVGSSFINLTTQVQAISLALQSAGSNSKILGDTLIQLVGAAANSTSLAQMKIIIEGMGKSGLSTAKALDAMYAAFLRVDNKDAANGLKVLRNVAGITEYEVAFIMGATAKGFNAKVDKNSNKKQLLKDAEAAVVAYDKASVRASQVGDYRKTKAYKEQEKELSITKTQINLLKKKKKLIDDQIKQQETTTKELKRQNEFLDTQRDLDQKIVEAKIKGNYIEAAVLLAEKQQNVVEFNKETGLSVLQSQSDKIQKQIDDLELNNQKLVDAINKGTTDAATNASNIVAAIDNIKPGSISGPATSRTNVFDTDKIGGPSVAATDIDPETGDRIMSLHGLNARLISLKGGGRGFKVGDLIQLGKGKDVLGLPSEDTGLSFYSGSVEITRIDRKTQKFYYKPSPGTVATSGPAVPKKADGGYIKHFGPGGNVAGPGTSTSDLIPAMLSNGEYVLRASAVKQYGVDHLNAMNVGKFAEGGLASRPKYGKKQNAFQRYVSSLTKSSDSLPAWARDPFGADALLRMFAGQGRKGDSLSASLLPLNFMGMGAGKNLFLGMPRGIKALEEARTAEKTMQGIHESIQASKLKDLPITKLGEQLEATVGQSFPVKGIGGLFKGANGTKEFVKPVTDELSALSEIRSNAISRKVGLTTPIQDLIKIIDPSDSKGKRTLLALRSSYNSEFAKPTGEFTESEYITQLVASLWRGDKDLQKANLSGKNLVDAGTSGVYDLASGIRKLSTSMPSMKEQAAINLLGVKGGAKRWFAETTAPIARLMKPKEYSDKIRAEIKRQLPLIEQEISSFKLTDSDQITAYENLINRVRAGAEVTDWSSFQAMAASVVPATPKTATAAALAKKAAELELRKRQSGHAVGFSDTSFKEQLGGYANGGLIGKNKYTMPSFKVGTDYVPNDMIAQIHKGERVLTAEENKNFSSSGPVTNNIIINGSDLNKKEIAQAVMVELDRVQKKNNKSNMVNK